MLSLRASQLRRLPFLIGSSFWLTIQIAVVRFSSLSSFPFFFAGGNSCIPAPFRLRDVLF